MKRGLDNLTISDDDNYYTTAYERRQARIERVASNRWLLIARLFWNFHLRRNPPYLSIVKFLRRIARWRIRDRQRERDTELDNIFLGGVWNLEAEEISINEIDLD